MSLRAGALLLAFVAGLGCAKQEDVIVQTGAGKELTPAAIDADALALLPPNPVGVMALDAQALFASRFGTRLLSLLQSRSPVPAAAEFQPQRDLERAYVGYYSMQGVDVAGIAIGKFKPDRIAAAADANPRTPSGMVVTRGEYTGRAVYTSQGLGFTVLTERTLLFGNETGIRRALDRIQGGRVQRKLLPWMADVLESKKAPITLGADFTSQPLSQAIREQVNFVDGLKTLSLVGNFQEPGLNLAGTLSYEEADAATRGAANLRQTHERLATYGVLMSLLGITQPVRSLTARAEDKQVRFVAGVDGAAVLSLLEQAETYLKSLTKTSASSPGPS